MTLTDSLCLVNKLLLYFNSVSSVKREKVMVMMMMMKIMIIKNYAMRTCRILKSCTFILSGKV
jgi:hypothetical protein